MFDEVEEDPFALTPEEEAGEPALKPPPTPSPAEKLQRELPKYLEKINSLPIRILSDYEMANPVWLWKDRILKDAANVIEGHPGIGKSSVLMDLVARMTAGRCWPGEAGHEKHDIQRVLWLTLEDAPNFTLLPRLRAAGGDPDQVVCGTVLPMLGGVRADQGQLEINRLMLERTVFDSNADVVVLDPGSACLEDGNSEPIARQVFGLLYQMGEDYGVTSLWIRHLAKASGDRSPMMAGIGSIGVAAAARSVLQLIGDVKQQEEGELHCRYLCHVKSNLSRLQPTLSYGIQGKTVPGTEADPIFSTVVTWGGEVAITAQGLNQKNSSGSSSRGKKDIVMEGLEKWFQVKEKATPGEITDKINELTGKSAQKLSEHRAYWPAFFKKHDIAEEGSTNARVYIYSKIEPA